MTDEHLLIVRLVVFAGSLSQALYCAFATAFLGVEFLPLGLIFYWMILPALVLSATNTAMPLGVGLAAGGLVANIALSALLEFG